VTSDYLGSGAAWVTSLAMAALNFMTLWAYYVGLSKTMEDASGVSAEVWVAAVFLVGLYFLSRKSLNSTIASALVVGMVNIGLLLLLSLLALTHFKPENFLYANIPFLNGKPFESSILGLVFGVVLASYYGHLSVSYTAKTVLKREPSGRSLVLGAMAGMLAAVVLYSLWVLSINSAIPAQVMAAQAGTSLAPLAAQVGPLVHVLGSIFAVLAMGMASIHASLGLFHLIREWLPIHAHPVVTLGRRRGKLLFQPNRNDSSQVEVTYLGLEEGQPWVRFDVRWNGKLHPVETRLDHHWQSADLRKRLPDLRDDRLPLTLETIEASQEYIRLRIDTPMSMSHQIQWDTLGLGVADALELSEPLMKLVKWLLARAVATFDDIAAYLQSSREAAREVVDSLIEQGVVRETPQGYEVRWAARRGRELTSELWEALISEDAPARNPQVPQMQGTIGADLRRILLSERTRFLLSASPVIAVFLLTEGLLITGQGSFSGLLNFIGAIIVPLMAGVFPLLLFTAGRRKGDLVPGVLYSVLGHPVLVGGIYLLFLSSLFVYGLVIWQNPLERLGALAVGVFILAFTLSVLARGALKRRTVVEVRANSEENQPGVLNILSSGQPLSAEVRLDYPNGEQVHHSASLKLPDFGALRSITIRLPDRRADDLKVWLHTVSSEGQSEALPGRVQIGAAVRLLSDGQIVLPIAGGSCEVKIALSQE
jgi:hypothetical protein